MCLKERAKVDTVVMPTDKTMGLSIESKDRMDARLTRLLWRSRLIVVKKMTS